MHYKALIAMSLLMSGIAASAEAACRGDACRYLVVQEENGCIVLVNNHESRRIRVDGDNWVPGYVYYVQANSRMTPKVQGGGCHRDWYSSHNATFAD